MKITRRDIEGMALRLRRTMVLAGVLEDGAPLSVEFGSKVNGNSYRIVSVGGDGRRCEPFSTFHFGFTARDCYDRMHAICAGLDLAYQNGGKSLRRVLKGADEVSTGDHSMVVHYPRPTDRDDAVRFVRAMHDGSVQVL